MRFLTLLAATLVATLTASAQLPEYIPSDGLIAFYPMDGDAMDAGPHGLDGTLLALWQLRGATERPMAPFLSMETAWKWSIRWSLTLPH